MFDRLHSVPGAQKVLQTQTRSILPFPHFRVEYNRERCIASGADEHGNIKTLKLQVISGKCKPGFKCFKRKSDLKEETCEVSELS